MTAQRLATPVQRGPAICLRFQRRSRDTWNVLCGKGYLRGADAIKLMNAPSANFTATVTTTNGIDALSAAGGVPALKVWMNQDVDPATTIFCTTMNYVYDTALVPTAVPYSGRGFVTIKKGGDAAIYRVGQAVAAGWTSPYDIPEFSRR